MRRMKLIALYLGGAVLLGSSGCLPDNFWADKWGEIVNGVIVSVVNSALAGTGIAI